MLRLSRKTALALEAVLDVAYNARPDPVQSRDITARQGIPARYLEQVLQQLVRERILKGVRGPRGGYTLARERRRITLGQIVRVIGNMDADDDDAVSAADLGEKVIGPIWQDVQSDMLVRLDAITMDDLCRKATDIGIPRADERTVDYTI